MTRLTAAFGENGEVTALQERTRPLEGWSVVLSERGVAEAMRPHDVTGAGLEEALRSVTPEPSGKIAVAKAA